MTAHFFYQIWGQLARLFCVAALLAGCQPLAKPPTADAYQVWSEDTMAALFAGQDGFSGYVSLEEAMARALMFNLDQRVKSLNMRIAEQSSALSRYDQWPSLDLSASQTHRNRDTTSTDDRDQTAADLTLAWNLLDFGVSYIQSRQAQNKVYIAQERQRKAANQLLIQTYQAYWRASAADQLQSLIAPLQIKLQQALKNTRTAEKRRLQPPSELLDFQKMLLETINQLNRLRKDLLTAKVSLSRLINAKPGATFSLKKIDVLPSNQTQMPEVAALESYALINRPELREALYKQRVSADATRIAMLRMLPGIELSFGQNYNSGDSYVNHAWAEAGAQIAWNLMKLVSAPQQLSLSESQEEITRMRAMAMHVSVLSQVNIAYLKTLDMERSYRTAQDLRYVVKKLYEHAKAGHQAVNISEMDLLRREADLVLYTVKEHLAYVEMQAAKGELLLSLGVDFVPEELERTSLFDITLAIQQQLQEVNSGSVAGITFAEAVPVKTLQWKIEKNNVSDSEKSVVKPIWTIEKSN